jgi:hypothetical protein
MIAASERIILRQLYYLKTLMSMLIDATSDGLLRQSEGLVMNATA